MHKRDVPLHKCERADKGRAMADQDQSVSRSDADLIAAILAGSPGAADALARRHYPAVLAALTRQLGDSEEARDLAQDAFLDAFRALGDLRTPRTFPAWLRRIARNRARQVFRQRAQAPPQVPLEEAPELTSPPPTAEQWVVRRTLAALAPDDRAILIMDSVLNMPGADIAAALGLSRAAAYARVERARARFLARYAKEQDEEGGGRRERWARRERERRRRGAGAPRGGRPTTYRTSSAPPTPTAWTPWTRRIRPRCARGSRGRCAGGCAWTACGCWPWPSR